MTRELEALLGLQHDDDVVDGFLARLNEVAPRLTALEAAREAATNQLNQARGTVEEDERRQRETERRVSDHKTRQERNLQHLDVVKRMREATAAMMQVDAGKKILIEEESELRSLTMRVADGHTAVKRYEQALADLELDQAAERETIDAERQVVLGELSAARTVREASAAKVDAITVMKYDKIRARRKSKAVFALADGACSACDTAVPAQRRNVMSHKGRIEVCEGCGVLLYAME